MMFDASQVLPADLSAANEVTLDHSGGGYAFINQGRGPQAGSMYVKQAGNVPANKASVGIGMSGAGTFALQAKPNVTSVFTPKPRYWIAAGTYDQGVVLDISTVTNFAEVDFPFAVHSTSSVNARFVELRKSNAMVPWDTFLTSGAGSR